MNYQNFSTLASERPRSFGGALKHDDPDYVKRDTDEELLKALKDRDFCCVLNSTQTGKSSLMNRMLHGLEEYGFLCVSIDLTTFVGSDCTSSQFYRDFSEKLIEKLKTVEILLSFDLENWWQKKSSNSAMLRLESFITDIILKETSKTLVIFVDEINSISEFKFGSDFFGLIRSFYNRRSTIDDYKRLTFALLGIATPSQLYPNEKISRFNIGKNIKLRPFQPHEITPLKDKLVREINYSEAKATEAMEKVLLYTNGHPYLTHSLCQLVIDENTNFDVDIDQLVEEKVIKGWQNSHYQDHFDRIRRNLSQSNQRSMSLLDLYKKILVSSQENHQNNNHALQANANNMVQIDLQLLGLVLEEDHILKPYCKIYEEIFDQKWIEDQQRETIFHKEDFDNYRNADERQKQLYLLTGKILKRTLEWAEHSDNQPIVTHVENKFFEESEQFWNKVQKAFPNQTEDKWETIVKAINDLTGGFYQFSNVIFNIIANNNNVVDLQQNEVHGRLEDLVFSHLNLFEEYDQFQKDRDQFLNQDDSFELISLFEKITQNEPILFDEKNPQHRKLKDMCFIILDKEHNLRILNKIYEKILDQNWIKEVMAGLRPYTKAFRDWQHSDRQESSYLLQNNDLKLALEWLGKKPTPKLEEGEIEFVMTSLVAEVWTTASPSVQSEAVSLITTFRPSLQGKNNYSDFLLREILQWTRHEPLLLRELLEVVNKTEIFTTNYHNWIEQLVKTQIINNWQDSKLAEHFRLIEQRLTNHQSSESFWLIVKYRQILLQGKIEFDEIREDTKLIELGLVVKLDQQLEIANPIYENIFSQRWTYQKLSECKRIRAINLLKWCPANIPEQNDPVLRSYLDEWINNNATIIEKIVQEAKGEVLDNKFDFIDEIKLLTYDIVKMDSVETSQIQLCLDRTFDKETKKMKQDNLDKLLSTIVEEGTAIEAVAIVNLEEGGLEYYNKELETSKPEIYRALFGQRDASEALADFADLKGIPTALKTFGAATKYGALEYSLFYLDKGIVIVDFLDLPEVTVAICFIATTEANPTKIVRQYRDRIDELKSQLEKTLG
ncbi:AAA-like domain-containing protein [Microcystis aeruginosa LEGE 00239]|uniref:AAA-like domain-containing protein n=1 Tax=Microcystis aeruginosa TaxID=1126 RepID=UPI00187F7862|nr:AAA-like domain-containing protein [Microcystis aeruginosa]MBE9246278.1 AAA-like domain-containing protein [Microcystis aeruginosa LEGE 00239]